MQNRYNFSDTESRKHCRTIAAHISQGVEFHVESKSANALVRPVMQYYSYLNIAVAVILCHRPKNYFVQQHGLSDTTAGLDKLDITTKVLNASRGAVPSFHSIISPVPIAGREFRIRDLVAAIPDLSFELNSEFGLKQQRMYVEPTIEEVEGMLRIRIRFYQTSDMLGEYLKPAISERKITQAMPILKTGFEPDKTDPNRVSFFSRRRWSKGQEREIEKTVRRQCMQVTNFGGQLSASHGHHYVWSYLPRVQILPTLTACLLLSFTMASVCRYRANIIESIEETPLYLILDVFCNESDGIMIPAMRNLLYREEMQMSAGVQVSFY